MVKLRVEVDDWDTGISTDIVLPCDVKRNIDTTHELQIIDWDGDLSIGYYDDVIKLSNLIDDINSENPSMTLEMLTEILKASGCSELNDKEFERKICEGDFMLEEVEEDTYGKDAKEKCACYLATKMMIPFAKNITYSILENIKDNRLMLWNRIWDYYSIMGFQIITIGKKIYAFHWGDAVQE